MSPDEVPRLLTGSLQCDFRKGATFLVNFRLQPRRLNQSPRHLELREFWRLVMNSFRSMEGTACNLCMSVASSLFLIGFAGGASLADSEASYHSATEAQTDSASMNQRNGESENGREAETKAGTGSMSSAQHDSASEGTHSANPPMAQPALSSAPTAAAPQNNSAAKSANAPTVTNAPAHTADANKKAKVAAAPPRAKIVNYRWGNRHSSRVNRSYMVQTIHQAAR
jgi:hypothetical protein